MSRDGRDIGLAAVGFGFGIWAFFHGFNRLRRIRLIENLPTSTVRGLAMGLVELEGVIRPSSVLHSPLTDTTCAVYKFQVEEYRSSGKSGRWVTIAQGDSFQCPFYLEDATGKIKVYPVMAEMAWKPAFRFQTGIGKSIPDHLIKFLEQKGIRHRGWLGARKLRFTEWHMQEGFVVYVLGTAQPEDAASGRAYNAKLLRRLDELKIDRERFKKLDIDNDGHVSNEEWDAAVADIESELIQETMQTETLDNAHGTRIGWSENDRVFIISDCDQRDLVGRFFWKCLLCIAGGPALSLVTLAYLIWFF